ncbi:MAG TPA: hypothetical protein VFT67_01635, partial [Jatrophihabitantaceae bacterium]|nr:hypothetical protein [Jatrophihabitantaceae bacterium]
SEQSRIATRQRNQSKGQTVPSPPTGATTTRPQPGRATKVKIKLTAVAAHLERAKPERNPAEQPK